MSERRLPRPEAAFAGLAVALLALTVGAWRPVTAESGTTISAGASETCAVADDATVVCWTYNEFEEPRVTGPTPVTTDEAGVTPLRDVRSITLGGGHRCALLLDGPLVCWGQNAPTEEGLFGGFASSGGQLGDGTTTDSAIPVTVVESAGSGIALAQVSAVAVGLLHTCALLADSTVRCWGDNAHGQLGDGTTSPHAAPAPVVAGDGDPAPLSGVVDIAAGDLHTCALLDDTTVRCWGRNQSGDLGDGTEEARMAPTAVIASADDRTPLSGVTAISLSGDGATGFNGINGGAHSCALLADGRVMCWGDNSSGQVDTPTAFASGLGVATAPVEVTGLSGPATAVAVGGADTCALLADGTVECWGFAWDWGRVAFCLEDPTCPIGDEPPGPRAVGGIDGPLAGVAAISAGAGHMCGVLVDGTVRCWAGLDAGAVEVPGLGGIAAAAATPTPEPTPSPTPTPEATATPAPTPVTTASPTAAAGGTGGSGTGGEPTAGAPAAVVAFHESVPTPAQVNLELPILLQSLILTVALLVFVPFPSTLFNSTLEENYAEVMGWFRRPRQWLRRLTRWTADASTPMEPAQAGAGEGSPSAVRRTFASSGPGVASFLLLTALVASFLDPTFGLDARSVATFAGLAIGLVVTLAAFSAPRVNALRVRKFAFVVRALPGTAFIGIACVLLSRLTDFQPGYLYGLVIGIAAARDLGHPAEGQTAALSTGVMLGVAFAAWIGLGLVADAATQGGEDLWLLGIRTALTTILVAGLEGALFGLMPVRFLPGGSIRQWNWIAWLALGGVALLGYFVILINPTSGYLSDTSRVPFAMIVGLLALFGVGSVLFWAYFRYRRPASPAPPAPNES